MQVGGHNIAKSDFQFIQTMQVGGAQHSEIESSISTNNASWETGQNTEAGGKSPYNNVRVGGAPTQKLAESQLL